jgi:hypothetical protein
MTSYHLWITPHGIPKHNYQHHALAHWERKLYLSIVECAFNLNFIIINEAYAETGIFTKRYRIF